MGLLVFHHSRFGAVFGSAVALRPPPPPPPVRQRSFAMQPWCYRDKIWKQLGSKTWCCEIFDEMAAPCQRFRSWKAIMCSPCRVTMDKEGFADDVTALERKFLKAANDKDVKRHEQWQAEQWQKAGVKQKTKEEEQAAFFGDDAHDDGDGVGDASAGHGEQSGGGGHDLDDREGLALGCDEEAQEEAAPEEEAEEAAAAGDDGDDSQEFVDQAMLDSSSRPGMKRGSVAADRTSSKRACVARRMQKVAAMELQLQQREEAIQAKEQEVEQQKQKHAPPLFVPKAFLPPPPPLPPALPSMRPAPPTLPPLSLYKTDDILAELRRRCDG